jgi:hypothetical protein
VNWDIIGATGEWAGALVVVLTLFYLARQIKASHSSTAIAAENTLITDYNRLLEQLYSDPELCSLVLRSADTFNELGRTEKLRIHSFLTSQIFTVQNIYLQMLEGHVSQAVAEPLVGAMTSILKNPGSLEWWADAKNLFSPEYVAYIDQQHLDEDVKSFKEILPWMTSVDA